MTEPLEQLKATLKTHHQSLTTARRVVFQALQDQEPQTMRNLVVACQGKADRASIYRTVALYEKLDIVRRLHIGWKYQLELSDAFHHHHHHLTCQICGKTSALAEDAQLEKRLQVLAAAESFMISDHQLEIQGICQSCRSAKLRVSYSTIKS